jgi:hypothetical protein
VDAAAYGDLEVVVASDDDTSRVREAYCDDTYLRLAEVKAKYDLGKRIP